MQGSEGTGIRIAPLEFKYSLAARMKPVHCI